MRPASNRWRHVLGVVTFTGALAVYGSALADGPQESQRAHAAPDHSLTAKEYIQLGMPAPDRDWLGPDFAKAASVVETIAAKDPSQLPHYGSAQSGNVFARMVLTDNLAFYRNRTLPVATRFQGFVVSMESSNKILKTYLAAFVKAQVRPRDLIELSGYLLHFAATGIELSDEFMPTISKEDPTYATRLAGLEKMKGGMAGIVASNLAYLTEAATYPAADRLALVAQLKLTIPRILPGLSETQRLEIVTRIQELAKDDSLVELHPAIEELAAPTKAK